MNEITLKTFVLKLSYKQKISTFQEKFEDFFRSKVWEPHKTWSFEVFPEAANDVDDKNLHWDHLPKDLNRVLSYEWVYFRWDWHNFTQDETSNRMVCSRM